MASLEFPHQHPDATSSDTPPSSPSDHLRSKRRTRPATGEEGDNDHRHRHRSSSRSGRFLARMMEREDRDSKKMSTLLLLTNERLEGETVRANEAERKAGELIKRFREIIQGRDLALQETARVKEELGLYKVQLDNAQREIFRAQEIINQVAKEKHDAEEEAAKARSKARKLQEEKLVMMAREEGRRQGYEEGLSKGRRIGFEEGRSVGLAEDGPRTDDDEGEDADAEPIQIRPPRTPEQRRVQRTPVVAPTPVRATQGNRSRSNTYDTAKHAPTLPVPTLVTPISAPSISRDQRSPTTRTPVPVPVSAPSQSPESIRPIPIRNSIPSPAPHSTRILRDGFIPEADRDSVIHLPPPHELSVPVASPQASEQSLPPLPPSRPGSVRDPFGPTVHTRDYAYPQNGDPEQGRAHGVPRNRTTSSASRGSTTISQYDLVSPPRGSRRPEGSSRYEPQSPRSVSKMLHAAVEDPRGESYYNRERRSRTPQASSSRGRNEEEVSPTQQIVDDWRSANPSDARAATPAAAGYNDRVQSPQHLQSPRVSVGPTRPREVPVQPRATAQVQAQAQQDMSRSRSPIDWLKRRNRGHNYSNSSVPEILIEPPSGSPSDTSVATVTQPNLLSPEAAAREMPLPGDDELNEFVDANPHLVPPSNHTAPIVLPDNQLPFGFVPLSGPTTVMMASRSQTPRQSDQYAAAILPAGLSYPDSRSRPSTAFDPVRESFNAYTSPTSRHRKMSLGSASSPAPLQRPISLFSEDA